MDDLKSLILSVLIMWGFLRGVRLLGCFSLETSKLSPVEAERTVNCPNLLSVYGWGGPHICLFVFIDCMHVCRQLAQDWLCIQRLPNVFKNNEC